VAAPRVILLGDICIDLLLSIDQYPEHGADGMADQLNLQLGGGTNNSAITLSRLGVTAVPLACTGMDVWANYLLDRMKPAGLDTQYICSRPGATTGITIVAVTPDGERTMFSYRGANIDLCSKDVKEAAFDGAGWLHLSAYALLETPQRDALWRAVELAQSKAIPISLDLNDDVVQRQPNEVLRLLPMLDTCILGQPEVRWLGGTAGFESGLERLLDLGVSLGAVKLGSEGCLLATARERLAFPPFRVEVVDTTGAGDAFGAGIVYACLHQLFLPATAVLASALGALTATVPGAGLALPGKDEVLVFLKSQAVDSEGVREVLELLTKDERYEDGSDL
jgi:ribokinase